MSTQVKSEGIVLRRVRHGETSLILTVFTRDFGKVGLMAKGARGTKRPGAANVLEVLSEAQFVFYRKPGRDLQMLKEASLTAAHLSLRGDLKVMSVASAVLELVARCLKEDDPHPELFDAACHTLTALNQLPPSPLPVLWRFEMELFQSLGFGLQLERCPETGRHLEPPYRAGIRYRLNEGSFLHPDAHPKATADAELLPESFSLFSRIAASSREFAGKVVVSPRAAGEIQAFLARYLETHLPVRGQLKSLDALRWNQPAN